MKLLVQSDDYGITKASALGTLEAIKNGIVRNTGLFANMSWTEEVVENIKPYLDRIAFGVDLNASTGPSLLNKAEIPSLVHDNGNFLTSKENKALDTEANHFDHVVYDEIYREFEAQIKRFIELVGKKPDYLHGHAYVCPTTIKASLDLAHKYEIPYSSEIMENTSMHSGGMGWYVFPPTLENQAKSDLESFILADQNEYLKHEYGMLITHCGYVDKELMELSSFNLYRFNDLKGVTSPLVQQWIEENQIELITYKDLKGWY